MAVSKLLDLHHVKPKPKLIEPLPWLGRRTATTLYPNIYVPRSVYHDLRTANPDVYNIALVLHEQEHWQHIKRDGTLPHYWRYITSRRFRFEEELAAIAPQCRYLKRHGAEPMFDRRARLLSGWLYLWAVDYETALLRLQKIWDEV